MRKLKFYLSQAITKLEGEEKENYLGVYDFIEKFLTEEYNVEVFHPIKEESDLPAWKIYWRDLVEVKKAHFVVAEVSVVSVGVGQELTFAISRGKPILALFNKDSKDKLSPMVTGSGIRVKEYSGSPREKMEKDITKHIAEFMTELEMYLKLKRKLLGNVP